MVEDFLEISASLDDPDNLHTIVCAQEKNHVFLEGQTQESGEQLISPATDSLEFCNFNALSVELADESVCTLDTVGCDVGPDIVKITNRLI